MSDLYPRIMEFVRSQPWALMPEKHVLMVDLLRFRNAGGRLTREEISARLGAPKAERSPHLYDPETDDYYRDTWDSEGSYLGVRSETTGKPMPSAASVVAIIPILGLISQRASQVDDLSGPGGTSTERLTARFRGAMSDPAVKAVVLDVDSPGGSVYGVQELAEEIRAARGQKPVVAVANALAASSAYWLASSADEISVTPSGEVGSIGVYGAHEDLSVALEQQGIKVTLISAGKYKTEGNPFEALSEEGMVYWQARINEYYDAFVKAVAKGRGVGAEKVRKKYGEGRVLGAEAALEAGMVDKIETLDQAVRRVSGRGGASVQRSPSGTAQPIDTDPGLADRSGYAAAQREAMERRLRTL